MENKKYIDSFVAYIDILGFKEYVKNNAEFEIVNDLFCGIDKIREKALSDFNINSATDPITIKIISDSVVIAVPKTACNSFLTLLIIVSGFAFDLLSKYQLLCRGAITEGDFYEEKNIAFGPAFVDAYILENKTAVYPRIIFTRNTFNLYREISKNQDPDINLNHFLKYLVSLDPNDDLFYVDFIKFWLYETSVSVSNENMSSEGAQNVLNSITQTIKRKLSCETNPHIREKYLYLKKYYNRLVTPASTEEKLDFNIPFECKPILSEDYQEDLQTEQNYQPLEII